MTAPVKVQVIVLEGMEKVIFPQLQMTTWKAFPCPCGECDLIMYAGKGRHPNSKIEGLSPLLVWNCLQGDDKLPRVDEFGDAVGVEKWAVVFSRANKDRSDFSTFVKTAAEIAVYLKSLL